MRRTAAAAAAWSRVGSMPPTGNPMTPTASAADSDEIIADAVSRMAASEPLRMESRSTANTMRRPGAASTARAKRGTGVPAFATRTSSLPNIRALSTRRGWPSIETTKSDGCRSVTGRPAPSRTVASTVRSSRPLLNVGTGDCCDEAVEPAQARTTAATMIRLAITCPRIDVDVSNRLKSP